MTLRYKFVLPINLILVLVLGASLAWEWRRQEATGMSLLRARLDEEARFVHAAHGAFGATPRFGVFLKGFCHGIDPAASPEHQVALVDGAGRVVAAAAEHARRPMDPGRLAALGDGFWARAGDGEAFLVRVSTDGGRRVVVAESTRAIHDRVWANLRSQVLWFAGAGVLLIGAVNLIMRRAVLRPIRRIGRAVGQLERGRLGVEVASPNGDELGALARQFNAMSRTLADQAEAARRAMETARRVQAHLLPPQDLRLGCLEVAGRCLPAGPVGGDLYDVRLLPGGRVGVLVVDMSGHNVAAALHTAMVREIVWREAEQAEGPGEVLARLNERLCRETPEEHFATAYFGWFDPTVQRLYYANAGHPPAYLRSVGGTLRELEPNGPLLGILPDASYPTDAVEVEPDSLLLVYSDGLTEAWNPRGELWGTGELIDGFGSAGPPDPSRVVARILERHAAFRLGESQGDDMTIVVCRFEPVGSGDGMASTTGLPEVATGSPPRADRP